MPTPRRPEGTITRGTTAPNRLRRFDRYLLHRGLPALRSVTDPLIVDLGFGATATTTLELDRALSRVVPGRRVVGLEIEPGRVAAAQPATTGHVSFAYGGFEVPTASRPQVIRAANVLRQYPVEQVPAAWTQLAGRLAQGGLLIEGTCDELGRLASWVSLSAGCGVPETFTMSLRLAGLFAPSEVSARLPKALIHHNVPGQPIHAVLRAVDTAWARAASTQVFGPRQRWLAMIADLRAQEMPVLDGPRRWRLGELTLPWDAVAPTR
ncbi:MAG: class I SAM-dependent methyltransferase [Candidatus Nanopelagicales bacterium]